MPDLERIIAGGSELAARIDERAQEYLDWLIELAVVPSVSVTGEGVREVAALIAKRAGTLGLAPELLETGGSPIVWAGSPGGPSPHLLVYGHYDVVPAGDPADWPYPPWSATVADGSIWGRGVGDSKGQMIAHLCAYAAWLDVFGEPPPFRIDFMFDGEDEVGSIHTGPYIRANPDRFRADFLYTADASTLGVWGPAVFLGIRGALYVELHVPGPDQEWHSASYGGILPNALARACALVGSLTTADGTVAIRGFRECMDPIDDRVRALADALPATFLPPAEEFGIGSFTSSTPVSDMFFRPRVTVCGITGGYHGAGLKMAVPTGASVKLDFALLPGQHPSTIEQLLRQHLRDHGFGDVRVEVLARCPPTSVPFDHPLLRTAVGALEAVWGQEPVLFPSIGGGGVFANFVEAAGLTCLLVPYGQPDLQEHSAREHFSLEWFRNGIKTTAELYRRLAVEALSSGPGS